jgi:hypothetical protein
VDPAAYDALLVAARSGDLADFAAVPRGGNLIPINFADAFAYVLEGSDPHQFTMAPAPAFASEDMAADMVELYWRALARDIPFAQYGEEPVTLAAIGDLRQFPRFEDLTPETLFRGPAWGEATGPYLSQFLWKDSPFGAQRIVQTCRLPVPNRAYLTDYELWLRRQNGGPPGPPTPYEPTPRYLCCGRDVAEWVRAGFLGQSGWTAMLILEALGSSARAAGLPTAMSPFDLLGRVAYAAEAAGSYQKWGVHRSLRPEELGGRVHNHRIGAASYPIHSKLLNAGVLDEVFSRYGTYLLPMAYPIGAPPLPSYPSNEAVIAGAVITVVKALYNGDVPMPDPVVLSADGRELIAYTGPTLTVGGELNKLAANIAAGRFWAAFHFRADGLGGLKLGEDVTISILRDVRQTYGAAFDGFSFTKFDGTAITV